MQVIALDSGDRQPTGEADPWKMAAHQGEHTSQHHGFQLVALIVREHTAGELLLIVGSMTPRTTPMALYCSGSVTGGIGWSRI